MLKALFDRNSLIPTFTLTEASGQVVDTSRYKQRKNLVLVFLHGSDCEFCQRVARAFQFFASRYREENAEVLLILPERLGDARRFKENLDLPFKVLADEAVSTLAKYVEAAAEENEPLVAVIVTDRFGALIDQWFSARESSFPDVPRFLTSLNQAEIECPECGIHEWSSQG